MSNVLSVLPIVQSQRKVGQAVAYYPFIAKVLCSTDATLMICQFIFWCKSFEDETENVSSWIEKTSDEIYNATGVGYNSQVTARKHLKECGILTEKLFGTPARMHYKFDFGRLNELLTIGEPLKKTAKNPNQNKGEKGKFESASESFGNKDLTPLYSVQASEKVPSLVSENIGNLDTTFSDTTYKESFIKKEKETKKEKNALSLSENDSTSSPTPSPSLDAETKQATVLAEVVCPNKEIINPNLRKIYETPAQMSADLFALWKSSEGHAEALKAVVEPLGIKTTEKKILFGRYLRDNICSKILTSPTYGGSMQSVIELHKLIVFKYLTFKEIKAEILELKEEPKKVADEYDRTRATAKKDKYADM